VPLRAKVVEALELLSKREGILFPAPEGGRIDINNWRSREWVPAFKAAGLEHRRIYDMRHTFATWSLDAGMGIFTLARRMGTSVRIIDQTYGHLVRDADDQDRDLLDSYDARRARSGHDEGPRPQMATRSRTAKAPRYQGFYEGRERRDSNPRPPA
jgi:integrase